MKENKKPINMMGISKYNLVPIIQALALCLIEGKLLTGH